MVLVKRWVLTALVALAGCGGGEAPKADDVEEKPAEVVTTPEPPAEAKADATAAGTWTKLPEGHHPALLDPALAAEKAPEQYKVKFETTKGDFVVQIRRDWAPMGADRFYNLVKVGYFDGVKFFRAIDGFMVQFGISGYPDVNAKWRKAQINDDPVKESNTRGRISFAMAGPNTRTTQVFINYVDRNKMLDEMGFSPFGEVIEGMDVVDSLYKGYGEGAPRGRGPDQGRLQAEGNAYLESQFPELDGVKKATILP